MDSKWLAGGVIIGVVLASLLFISYVVPASEDPVSMKVTFYDENDNVVWVESTTDKPFGIDFDWQNQAGATVDKFIVDISWTVSNIPVDERYADGSLAPILVDGTGEIIFRQNTQTAGLEFPEGTWMDYDLSSDAASGTYSATFYLSDIFADNTHPTESAKTYGLGMEVVYELLVTAYAGTNVAEKPTASTTLSVGGVTLSWVEGGGGGDQTISIDASIGWG